MQAPNPVTRLNILLHHFSFEARVDLCVFTTHGASNELKDNNAKEMWKSMNVLEMCGYW